MPDLGLPTVKEIRRLAAAYEAWDGPDTAPVAEVMTSHREQQAREAMVEHDQAGDTLERRFARPTRRQVLGGAAAVGAASALTAMGSASAAASSGTP